MLYTIWRGGDNNMVKIGKYFFFFLTTMGKYLKGNCYAKLSGVNTMVYIGNMTKFSNYGQRNYGQRNMTKFRNMIKERFNVLYLVTWLNAVWAYDELIASCTLFTVWAGPTYVQAYFCILKKEAATNIQGNYM